MSSGVRVAVALIVVAFVGIGLYYASLDQDGAIPAPEMIARAETPAPDPAPRPVIAASPLPEPIFEPTFKPIPEPIAEPTPEPEAGPAPRVSLGVVARGASVHLLVDPFMSEIDVQDVKDAFSQGTATAGPPGMAWVVLAEWVEVPDGEPVPWVMAERNGQTWVLLRDDAEGVVDLRRHVVASSERFDHLLKQSLVMFVLDDDATPELRELTYPNIGRDYAVVVDRSIVAVTIIRTAIEARGIIAPGCDRLNAKWIADRLRGDVSAQPIKESSGNVAETRPMPMPMQNQIQDDQTWIIGESDTFSSIAEEWFGEMGKWTLIANANPNVDPARLQIGQEINLPPKDTVLGVVTTDAKTHTVASGETLSDIAYAYYGKARYWRDLFEANRTVIGDNPAALEVGMELAVPSITTDE